VKCFFSGSLGTLYSFHEKMLYIISAPKFFRGTYTLDRSEAVLLLKELINLNLIQPALISIEKNKLGTFSLKMKADGNLQSIKQFIVGKNLDLSEEKGYFVISTP
jgi:hypothetical protein